MSQIEVMINGRDYKVGCEDGQEDHIRQLAQYVNKHIEDLEASVGQVGDNRLLVLACLVIADELSETVARIDELEYQVGDIRQDQTVTAKKATSVEGKVADILEAAAKRIEDLTEQVEPISAPPAG